MILEKRCPICRGNFDIETESKTATCPHCNQVFVFSLPASDSRNPLYTGGICLKYTLKKKKCPKCKKTKPIDEFKKDLTSPYNHSSRCKFCMNEQYRLRYKKAYRPKLKSAPEIHNVSARSPLSSVLSHLINISKNGYYSGQILNESINIIKETIIEGTEAGN